MEIILVILAMLLYVFYWQTAIVCGFVMTLVSPFALPVLLLLFYQSMELYILVSLFIGSCAGWFYRPSYYDGAEYTGERSWRWFRRLRLWRLLHWWTNFNAQVDPMTRTQITKPCVIAVHPHGFLPIGSLLEFCLPGTQLPKVDVLVATLEMIFSIPGLRELFLWSGAIVARRDCMLKILEKGKALVVVPGGLREGMLHDHNHLRMCFDHQGFIEIAQAANVPLIPVFAQGENRLWFIIPVFTGLRKWFYRHTRVPFPTFFVPFIFPHELNMRYGKEMKQPATMEEFEKAMIELVETHEDSMDFDMSEKKNSD